MAEYGLKRYFNGECAHRITKLLQDRLPDLDGEEFAGAVDSRIQGLELKDRVMVIAEELRLRIPDDYVTAVGMLVDSLGDELREDQGMFTESWFLMPVARYVEEYGIEYPHESLDAIEEITKRHTGEYAIRPYLRRWQALTISKDHPRYAVSTAVREHDRARRNRRLPDSLPAIGWNAATSLQRR